jgi:hypothetical protein
VMTWRDPERLINICVVTVNVQATYFSHGTIHEWSRIFRRGNLSIFCNGKTAVCDWSLKLPASRLQQWTAYPLLSELKGKPQVSEMSVTNQHGGIRNQQWNIRTSYMISLKTAVSNGESALESLLIELTYRYKFRCSH